MNPLQYKFDFWMFICGWLKCGGSLGFNGTPDKLVMARNLKDILFSKTMWWRLFVRYLDCTYIYVALTVFSHSHYGYCKSFCRVDYVIPYV